MYEKLKTWLSDKDNRQKAIYAISFVLVFLVGFGTGGAEKDYRKSNKKANAEQVNYTTKVGEERKPEPPPAGGPTPQVTTTPEPSSTSPDCPIKGNISSKDKVYHIKGGAFYDRTKEEICFKTEEEAVSAGFRKSSR